MVWGQSICLCLSASLFVCVYLFSDLFTDFNLTIISYKVAYTLGEALSEDINLTTLWHWSCETGWADRGMVFHIHTNARTPPLSLPSTASGWSLRTKIQESSFVGIFCLFVLLCCFVCYFVSVQDAWFLGSFPFEVITTHVGNTHIRTHTHGRWEVKVWIWKLKFKKKFNLRTEFVEKNVSNVNVHI